MNKLNNISKKEYENLKAKYQRLKIRYKEVRSRKTNLILAILTYLLGILCIIEYRQLIILEAGILLMLVGLMVELHGTKKGAWDYADSLYMINKRVPIEIALQYFFIGIIGANYYFFRTQTVTGFIL